MRYPRAKAIREVTKPTEAPMRTDTTILAQLDRQFQWMHAYRRRLLCELTLTLVRKGRGWLTALGRDLDSSTCAKHRIKRVDRFVGNPRLHAEVPRVYQSLCRTVIRTPRPVVLVDWTVVTLTHWALVASIPGKGRAQIICKYSPLTVVTDSSRGPTMSGWVRHRIGPKRCG